MLEIGVGTGRLARRVLDMGCRTFTGLDTSAKTLERARENLAAYPNVRLVLGDVEEFRFCERFDVAYSVLTFMHIERKRAALANIVEALYPHGILVLSLSNEGECL
ncbi:MAG: class I SAM-dependent methyltransferase, partial [Bacillota bacterium]